MKTKKQIIAQINHLQHCIKLKDVDRKYADGYMNALNWVIDND